MSRYTKADDGAFRVKVVRTFPPSPKALDGYTLESYRGPYGRLSTAKGVRTQIVGEAANYARAYEDWGKHRGITRPSTVVVTIESASQVWTEVEE